jgi:hypothetical protein
MSQGKSAFDTGLYLCCKGMGVLIKRKGGFFFVWQFELILGNVNLHQSTAHLDERRYRALPMIDV